MFAARPQERLENPHEPGNWRRVSLSGGLRNSLELRTPFLLGDLHHPGSFRGGRPSYHAGTLVYCWFPFVGELNAQGKYVFDGAGVLFTRYGVFMVS
jgi:hypothetical protein